MRGGDVANCGCTAQILSDTGGKLGVVKCYAVALCTYQIVEERVVGADVKSESATRLEQVGKSWQRAVHYIAW